MSQALKAVEGVVDAEVSYDDKRAQVEYDPAAVSPEQLVETINDTGFVARLPDEGRQETSTLDAPDDSVRRR